MKNFEIKSPVKIKKTTQKEKDEFIKECIKVMDKHRKGFDQVLL